MLRPVFAWWTFLNLRTVYFFNFPIFSGRGKPRILNQWIRGHTLYTVQSDIGHTPSGSLQSDKQMFWITDLLSFRVMSFCGRHWSHFIVIIIHYTYSVKLLPSHRFHLEYWIQHYIHFYVLCIEIPLLNVHVQYGKFWMSPQCMQISNFWHH
jgi:hypothetical protein